MHNLRGIGEGMKTHVPCSASGNTGKTGKAPPIPVAGGARGWCGGCPNREPNRPTRPQNIRSNQRAILLMDGEEVDSSGRILGCAVAWVRWSAGVGRASGEADLLMGAQPLLRRSAISLALCSGVRLAGHVRDLKIRDFEAFGAASQPAGGALAVRRPTCAILCVW
jgi:hypothetical protein